MQFLFNLKLFYGTNPLRELEGSQPDLECRKAAVAQWSLSERGRGPALWSLSERPAPRRNMMTLTSGLVTYSERDGTVRLDL